MIWQLFQNGKILVNCPLDGSPGKVLMLEGLWHEKNPKHVLTKTPSYLTWAVQVYLWFLSNWEFAEMSNSAWTTACCCQLLVSKCDAICVQSYPDVCRSLISWGCLWKRFKRSSALYPSDMINPFRMLHSTGAAKLYYICFKCVPFQFVEKPSSPMNKIVKPTENAFCHVWLNPF